jgi:hypothetical protein
MSATERTLYFRKAPHESYLVSRHPSGRISSTQFTVQSGSRVRGANFDGDSLRATTKRCMPTCSAAIRRSLQLGCVLI